MSDHPHHSHKKANDHHCHNDTQDDLHNHPHSCHSHGSVDWLLWASALIIILSYIGFTFFEHVIPNIEWLNVFGDTIVEMVNTIWWGVLIGVIMLSALTKVPKEYVVSLMGRSGGFGGMCRATLGGILLDLCSHGILMVAAKLYERGVSTGQVMAFLIASPWNSFSLTLVLIALVGLPWALGFIALSAFIAIVTGLIFEGLTKAGRLPVNPNSTDIPDGFNFWKQAKTDFKKTNFNAGFFKSMLKDGASESRMVLRWIFFGVVLAGIVRALMDPEQFQDFFGPTLIGLGLTMVAATILEVCSEGSMPVAADLLNRGGAPGNAFAFLMTGVSTDYTEIAILKETTKTWKIPLFLPLITVPQILLFGWLINYLSV